MGEDTRLLQATADRVFAGCDGLDVAAAQQRIAAAGLFSVMVDPEAGGYGGGWEDAFVILSSAGEHAICFPIAESILAVRILAESGVAIPPGPISIAPRIEDAAVERDGDHLRVSGVLSSVAFGMQSSAVVAILPAETESFAACLEPNVLRCLGESTNIPDEPRCDFAVEDLRVATRATQWTQEKIYRAMALARSCQMAGAIAAALSLSVNHTRQREQFGRPLASFQAIQQELAVLAEEAAAARAAAQAACRAADRGGASFEIAAAKLRVNQAAGTAASIAHQVHGAIGFTRAYALQKFTRRLWAWRSEYGNERRWAAELGARAARAGAEGFWPALVSGFAD